MDKHNIESSQIDLHVIKCFDSVGFSCAICTRSKKRGLELGSCVGFIFGRAIIIIIIIIIIIRKRYRENIQ
jgi:hypothetical protein